MLHHIFSPVTVGQVQLKNRLVVPAMVMGFCNSDGTVTERFMAYHEAKAKGGWGLIITEDYAIDPGGIGYKNIPGIWSDNHIEGNRRLTERIHRHGGKIFAQLYHAGRQTNSAIAGRKPVAPSSIPCPVMREMPDALSVDDIHNLVEKFGDGALRARKAGFDGVEVHGAHGYLVAQFMSLYSNKRTDEYGGGLSNRARFAVEIVTNIREKVGTDFPIIFRLSGEEFVPDGLSIEDSIAVAMLLERAGVDAIHVSAGVYASRQFIIPPAAVGHGWITDLAAKVKKAVKIPVITVGRINDPLLAEAILASGKADLVAMGRASLADPDLPHKAAAGRFEDIIHCIGCLQGCWGRGPRGRCILNPLTGRELELVPKVVEARKKVFIAGGGPGGMEAAIVAATRGHEVHLYEKTGRLGGQLALAAVPPHKGEIASFVAWQKKQVQSLGVRVYLNTPLTLEIVKEKRPDAVIVATGSKPQIPSIRCENGAKVCTAHEVLDQKVEVGQAVIVIGGGATGAETASYLANQKRLVTLIEMGPSIGADEEDVVRHFLVLDLQRNDVKILVNSAVTEVKRNGVVVLTGEGERELGPADTIVVATGVVPDDGLALELKDKVGKLLVIGDAREPRNASFAIEEGYMAGLKV